MSADIVVAVQQQLLRFFHDFDHWHYDRMLAAFTPDGAWDRNGKVLQGRDAILAELQKRPEQQVVRHVLANIVVEAQGEGQARATFLVTAYRHDGEREPARTPVLAGPLMVLDGAADLSLQAGEWLFTRQQLRRVFEFRG